MKLNRRQFVGASGAALLLGACEQTPSAPSVTAPTGQIDKIGIQTYTLREAMAEDFVGKEIPVRTRLMIHLISGKGSWPPMSHGPVISNLPALLAPLLGDAPALRAECGDGDYLTFDYEKQNACLNKKSLLGLCLAFPTFPTNSDEHSFLAWLKRLPIAMPSTRRSR